MFKEGLTDKILKELSVSPVSRLFGFDRGMPIDRYYIEKFLSQHKECIKGDIMEVADRDYSMKYGGSDIEKSYILHLTQDKDELSIKGNLETGEGIIEDLVDCFILTQTLPFMYDLKSAVKNIIKTLKPGGYALITVPGITQISRYDMDRWGQYWSFTDLSLRMLFEEVVGTENVEIHIYGNAKSSACFLYGLAYEELTQEELEQKDIDYQMLICAKVKKPEGLLDN